MSKKITQKRLKAFAKKVQNKLAPCETIGAMLKYYRALNRATFLLCLHHQKDFKPENYKPLNFGQVLKNTDVWKDQREIRRYYIQSHRDFFCPISKQCLDIDRSFIIQNVIFDFAALPKLKPENLKLIDLT